MVKGKGDENRKVVMEVEHWEERKVEYWEGLSIGKGNVDHSFSLEIDAPPIHPAAALNHHSQHSTHLILHHSQCSISSLSSQCSTTLNALPFQCSPLLMHGPSQCPIFPMILPPHALPSQCSTLPMPSNVPPSQYCSTFTIK